MTIPDNSGQSWTIPDNLIQSWTILNNPLHSLATLPDVPSTTANRDEHYRTIGDTIPDNLGRSGLPPHRTMSRDCIGCSPYHFAGLPLANLACCNVTGTLHAAFARNRSRVHTPGRRPTTGGVAWWSYRRVHRFQRKITARWTRTSKSTCYIMISWPPRGVLFSK